MNRRLKAGLVVVGAVVLSTIAINASDVLQGIDGSMSGLAIEGLGPCGSGAVLYNLETGSLCVDAMEASPDESCTAMQIRSEVDTRVNLNTAECTAVSKIDAEPWRYVSLTEAQQLCARSGKRLPTNEEWYHIALGLSDQSSCVIAAGNQSPARTGTSACVTPTGVHDLVGNVWEWTDTTVVDGNLDDYTLPEGGYVTLVSPEGVVLETTDTPDSAYGEDYAWTHAEGVRGIIRGGFYNSQSDAGLFTMNAAVALDFRAAGVGFRCVQDLY